MSGQHRNDDHNVGTREYGGVHRRRRDDLRPARWRGKWRLRIVQSLVVYGVIAVLSLTGGQGRQHQAHPVGGDSSISDSYRNGVGIVAANRPYNASLRGHSYISPLRRGLRVHDRPSGNGGVAPVQSAVVSIPTARTAPPQPTAPPSQLSYYDCSALEQLWDSEGGNPSAAVLAASVAMAESGGNPDAVSPTDDYGLWQINGSWGSMASLSPDANARAAISISGDGNDWSAWTTYTSGAYAGRC